MLDRCLTDRAIRHASLAAVRQLLGIVAVLVLESSMICLFLQFLIFFFLFQKCFDSNNYKHFVIIMVDTDGVTVTWVITLQYEHLWTTVLDGAGKKKKGSGQEEAGAGRELLTRRDCL